MATSEANLFRDLAKSIADRSAMVALCEGPRRLTYAEFGDLVARSAASIRLTPAGAVIGIAAATKIDTLAGYYTCFAAGRTGVVLPVDPESAAQIVSDAKIATVLAFHERPLPQGIRQHEPLKSSRNDDACAGIDPAMIIYTSGTTSTLRKGVLIAHRCVSDCARFMNDAMGVDASIHELVVAPIDHLYGFGRCHSVLKAGGSITLATERAQISTMLGAITDGCNALGVVPSVLATLIQRADAELAHLGGRIRWLQTGAMRFEEKYRRRLLELFPNASIGLHYGLSEVMRATFLNPRDHPGKLHTEGVPRPGVEISIRDESGTEMPAECEGDIWIAGTAVALGYTDASAWTQRTTGAWFRTGDVGFLDRDGFLVFRGRNDDIVNINGNLVHPAEVERRLSGLIAAPYCVVGAPDPRGVRDTILVICIEGETTVDVAALSKCLGTAERHFIPERAVNLASFPRTETGKIKRNGLTKLAAELLTKSPPHSRL